MSTFKLVTRAFLVLFAILLLLGIAGSVALYRHFAPQLPDVETLKEIKLQTPLKIFSQDGKLVAEYGEKKRIPLDFHEIPDTFVQALRAAEDARFFEHHGIDIKGLTRAAYQLASTGKIKSGGSTITMQVAKNYFLTRERTFERKFSEILLALKIEQSLSKEEIFELYVNKIYLGHRAYGIQAAANVYYGKDINELSLPQLAMIAGLPKAPSASNPISNPEKALERRNWILGRMKLLNFISAQEYESATNTPVTARYHTTDIELNAPYIAEMVRSDLYEKFGEAAYTEGYRVYTTIDSRMQTTANLAVRDGLITYTKRHGYQGAEKNLPTDNTEAELLQQLQSEPVYAGIEPALITALQKQSATVLRQNGESLTLPWESMKWARLYKTVNQRGTAPKTTADIFKQGDIIRILKNSDKWELVQLPAAQSALISMTPKTGAIRALVGGFDFYHSKFNRAIQAARQPGSNFKPFIYAAALENGFTPASIINDAPVVLPKGNMGESWRPENASRHFFGPTRLRVGLYKSRNLVSIRLLRMLGVSKAAEYLARLGFDSSKIPNNLSLSLGNAEITPLELLTGYAVLANGGYKVTPYFISKIEDPYGNILYQIQHTDCADCPDNQPQRVMDPDVNFLLYSILQDVIRRGTGTRAKVLGRSDLAGKTGTTNEQKDAWFTGFNHNLVTTVWVGFDQPASLGRKEFGATAALPIWIDFMKVALEDQPNAPITKPEGVIQALIDPDTGLLAYPGQHNAVLEYFKQGRLPRKASSYSNETGSSTAEDIF